MSVMFSVYRRQITEGSLLKFASWTNLKHIHPAHDLLRGRARIMFRYLSPLIGHKGPLIGGDAAICHRARILDVHINRVSSRHFLSSLIILVFPSSLGSYAVFSFQLYCDPGHD